MNRLLNKLGLITLVLSINTASFGMIRALTGRTINNDRHNKSRDKRFGMPVIKMCFPDAEKQNIKLLEHADTRGLSLERQNNFWSSFKFDNLPVDVKHSVANKMDNPLIFGKTNIHYHRLVKKLGFDNLKLLYQTQDPSLLDKLYVPVLLISKPFDRNGADFWVINPYEESLYTHTQQISKRTRELENTRPWQAVEAVEKVENKNQYLLSINGKLPMAVLFGNDNDIKKELINESWNTYWSTFVAINYPNKNNHALELLLLKMEQSYNKVIIKDEDVRAQNYYDLLLCADTKNKEAFRTIAIEHSCLIGNNKWILSGLKNDTPQTTVERIVREGGFDKANVEFIARQHQCCICLQSPKHQCRVPCVRQHSDNICLDCCEKMYQHAPLCPICRSALR